MRGVAGVEAAGRRVTWLVYRGHERKTSVMCWVLPRTKKWFIKKNSENTDEERDVSRGTGNGDGFVNGYGPGEPHVARFIRFMLSPVHSGGGYSGEPSKNVSNYGAMDIYDEEAMDGVAGEEEG